MASSKSPPCVRRVNRSVSRAVTAAVSSQSPHCAGAPLKNASWRTEVIAAYQQVGTYRAAAAMCGTTHKSVKRMIEAAREGEAGGQRHSSRRRHNYGSAA